jgi:hypothetical protein
METEPLCSGPLLGPAMIVTLPLPTPELADVTVSQGERGLAVQLQNEPCVFCIETVTDPPADGRRADIGLIVNAHATGAAA